MWGWLWGPVAKAINKLSARTVTTVTDPGRYGDGGGLYLDIDPEGRKRWLLRFQFRGRRRDMGLGAVSKDNGLPEARQAARDAHSLISRGIDPIEARKRPTGVPTFADASERLIASLAPGWRGINTAANWRRSLLVHAAKLGSKSVDQIGTHDVLAVLKTLWTTKPESAGKLRERIERVLDSCKAAGEIQSPYENPARWRGHLKHMLPKRATLTRGHFRAMPWKDAPAFVQLIRTKDSMGARALEWTILTAARETMATDATWKEIHGDVWIIPAKRMKDNREHRVPLSQAAQALLDRLSVLGRPLNAYIFPGMREGRPISNATMDQVLIRLKLPFTVHGFRSTFREWAGDCTAHPREVAEAALAHAVGDAVERAYRRGDALEKRRLLMQDWADFLAKPPTADPQKPPADPHG